MKNKSFKITLVRNLVCQLLQEVAAACVRLSQDELPLA